MPTLAYKHMYNSALWRGRRGRQLRDSPLCEVCLSDGIIKTANTAHHIIPHKGSWELFSKGELRSLCESCHSSIEQSYEKRGYYKQIGRDGWPVHPDHPAYAPVVPRKNKK